MPHIYTSRKRNGCLDGAGGDGDGADSFSVMEHHLSDQHGADTPVKVPRISHDKPNLTSLIGMKRIPRALRAKSVKLQRNRSRTKKASINLFKADAEGQLIDDSVRTQPAALLGKHQTDSVLFHQLRNGCPVDTFGPSSSTQRHLSSLLPSE